jgi:hypothetical protein
MILFQDSARPVHAYTKPMPVCPLMPWRWNPRQCVSCRDPSTKALKVYALAVRQESTPNAPSTEEMWLESSKAATKIADAAGDGVLDLELGTQTGSGVMDNITCSFQDSLPQIQKLPPFEFNSSSSIQSAVHPGHFGQHARLYKSPASGSTDWLHWEMPEEDFETDGGKHSFPKPLNPCQLSILGSLTHAAHQILMTNPHGVLKHVLQKMLHDSKRAWNLRHACHACS